MGRWWRRGCTAIGLLIAGAVPCAAGEAEPGGLGLPLAEASYDLLGGRRTYRPEDLALRDIGPPVRRDRLHQRLGIDASLVVDSVLGFFRRRGVPLRRQHDERGGGLVGVRAAFAVGRDLPPLSFNLGDRPVEPLGAFYSARRGFRCAVVWPVERFTLRLEGGEDSEFGYFGIVGVQWLSQRLPLAIGVGVPMNLRDAEGDIGAIVQLRMRLD